MKTRLNLKPGQKGTKKLVSIYGDNLLCVRYWYDEKRKKRVKTVELIIEESDWEPEEKPADSWIVAVRVGPLETELQKMVRNAGGRWDSNMKLRITGYKEFSELGLNDRFVKVVN